MDVLSQILDSIDMKGHLYFSTEFSAPWSLEVPADGQVCRFHVVIQGACWVTVSGPGVELGSPTLLRPPTLLSTGDLALVPHGHSHLLQDEPLQPTVDLGTALEETAYAGGARFRWGGDGPITRMVCGYFGFDKEMTHPLLDGLPHLIHVKSTPTIDFGWIEPLTRFISQEAGCGQPGSEIVSKRLSEILFIQAIRHFAAQSDEVIPVLSGITDPQIGRALRSIHQDPGYPWTLESLARNAALSRTAFAQKFTHLVGMTATDYLTQHRMRCAQGLLRSGSHTAEVADLVGYRSEAAFNRRFKQHFGIGPGAYRRQKGAAS